MYENVILVKKIKPARHDVITRNHGITLSTNNNNNNDNNNNNNNNNKKIYFKKRGNHFQGELHSYKDNH